MNSLIKNRNPLTECADSNRLYDRLSLAPALTKTYRLL